MAHMTVNSVFGGPNLSMGGLFLRPAERLWEDAEIRILQSLDLVLLSSNSASAKLLNQRSCRVSATFCKAVGIC